VREKALKLDRELFWKQKRVKAEWMWMRGLQSGARCQGAQQRKPKPGNSVQGFL